MTRTSYPPISAYAAIGNLRTTALVGLDGAIDWCCFPHLDRPSVFAALLDRARGGRFRIAPLNAQRGEQRYLGDTNVLETSFALDGARLTITDFMPLRGDIQGIHGSEAPPEVQRMVYCEGGTVDVVVEWTPRFDYARAAPRLLQREDGWLARGPAGELLSLAGVTDGELVEDGFGPSLRARLRLREGERRVFVTRWDSTATGCGLDASFRWLDQTIATWRSWVRRTRDPDGCAWAGETLDQVTRSELALKLMIHADTGAIAAAPTTSLPETIGGIRNWDYRYCWIRDASLAVQALMALGHRAEAAEFLTWAERVAEAGTRGDWRLQIMYGLHGETELEEHELPHLEGYRGSRPVRYGNAAAKQRQLDVFGELLNSAYELVRIGADLDESLVPFLHGLADRACADWDQPDFGIWEVRSDGAHFTYSKLMIWLALERAVQLSTRLGSSRETERWRVTRELVARQVLERGYDPEVGAFVQSFGSTALDASNLLIPLYELLPYDDPRVQNTIDRTLDELTEDGLVYRYHADDGLPGEEGAFGLCTYWLVDALALSGRLDEAWEIFEGMTSRANHVGLLPEQIDVGSGEFLGNFPQAFTHIGLINSRMYLAYAEGREIPAPPLLGTPEHRAEAAALEPRTGEA